MTVCEPEMTEDWKNSNYNSQASMDKTVTKSLSFFIEVFQVIKKKKKDLPKTLSELIETSLNHEDWRH